jgi:uncharacterized protein YegL
MKKYNKIICILDRSGSMTTIINDAIGGLNTFLSNQKELDSNNKISILLFDTEHELYYDNVLLSEVPEFTKQNFIPRGGTALLDSIFLSIENEFDLLASLSKEERPEKTLVFILTDGESNSDVFCNIEMLKNKISEQREKFGWEFIFAGANIDSFSFSSSLGINNNIQYTTDGSGDSINVAYASVNDMTNAYFNAVK